MKCHGWGFIDAGAAVRAVLDKVVGGISVPSRTSLKELVLGMGLKSRVEFSRAACSQRRGVSLPA